MYCSIARWTSIVSVAGQVSEAALVVSLWTLSSVECGPACGISLPDCDGMLSTIWRSYSSAIQISNDLCCQYSIQRKQFVLACCGGDIAPSVHRSGSEAAVPQCRSQLLATSVGISGDSARHAAIATFFRPLRCRKGHSSSSVIIRLCLWLRRKRRQTTLPHIIYASDTIPLLQHSLSTSCHSFSASSLLPFFDQTLQAFDGAASTHCTVAC